MTTALVATALAAVGVVAASIAAVFYQSRLLGKSMAQAKEFGDNLKAELTINLNLQRQLGEVRRLQEDTLVALKDKENELGREIAARKVAERQRDEFLTELAKGGDPKAVAAKINADLEALSKLGVKP